MSLQVRKSLIPATSCSSATVRVLMIESNSDGVSSLPDFAGASQLEVTRAHSLSEATFLVQHSPPDWILLDPATSRPDELLSFLQQAAGIPIQVVAGIPTESPINADLPVCSTTPSSLETRIGALAAQVVQHAEQRRRTEANTASKAPAGTRLRERFPDIFHRLVDSYRETLNASVEDLPYGPPERRSAPVQSIVHRLGELRAHPKDVVELHLAAMHALLAQTTPQRSRAYLKEGQTLLLKVMGYLASQYLQASLHRSRGRGARSQRLSPLPTA